MGKSGAFLFAARSSCFQRVEATASTLRSQTKNQKIIKPYWRGAAEVKNKSHKVNKKVTLRKIPETNNEVVFPTVSVVQLALFREVPSTSH